MYLLIIIKARGRVKSCFVWIFGLCDDTNTMKENMFLIISVQSALLVSYFILLGYLPPYYILAFRCIFFNFFQDSRKAMILHIVLTQFINLLTISYYNSNMVDTLINIASSVVTLQLQKHDRYFRFIKNKTGYF